jgi:hypothetical protein
MCNFFSFVTDPVNHPAEYYHLDWEYRKANLKADDADSHSHICAHFALNEDVCNKYEFNPLTRRFVIDQINSKRDDSEAAEKWANRRDFKEVVEPLIIKPIVNPLELPKVEKPTDEQIGWLKEWTSVGASVEDVVWASVWASVWDSVGVSVWDVDWDAVRVSVEASVWNAVGASVRASVWTSVWASVWAYFSSFFAIQYEPDFSPAVNLWEAGLVPSFDGTTWRLHTGKNADIVFELTPEVQE